MKLRERRSLGKLINWILKQIQWDCRREKVQRIMFRGNLIDKIFTKSACFYRV